MSTATLFSSEWEVGQAYWSPFLGRKEEAMVGAVVWGLFWPGREGPSGGEP